VEQGESRCVGVGREQETQAVRGVEQEDDVAGRQPEDRPDPCAADPGRDLAAQLGDVRRGEVQTFSPSRS